MQEDSASVRHAADARYIGCVVVTTIVGRISSFLVPAVIGN